MHTPLPSEAILDSLEALWDMIEAEPEACVRAVLGHHLFVFIHPYYDGNGRIGRFLMNTLLASGGYPWTVIRMSRRDEYMKALEAASVKGQIAPFGGVHRAGDACDRHQRTPIPSDQNPRTK
jgi:Fic family protein